MTVHMCVCVVHVLMQVSVARGAWGVPMTKHVEHIFIGQNMLNMVNQE